MYNDVFFEYIFSLERVVVWLPPDLLHMTRVEFNRIIQADKQVKKDKINNCGNTDRKEAENTKNIFKNTP